MKRLRYSLFLLLLALTLFFNIERIDLLGQQNVLDIQSFVYTFTIIAVFSIIFVPLFWRSSPVLPIGFWVVIYLITKVIFYNVFPDQNPLLSGAYTYVTITEISFISILILYTHRLTNNLFEIESGFKKLVLRDDLKQVDEAREVINSELMRSRHYHRPMSVIVLKPEKTSVDMTFSRVLVEIQEMFAQRYTQTRLAQTIRQQVRLMDMVLEEQENGRFIILCPEIDAAESALLMERICAAVNREMAIDVQGGSASFPDEAPTFDGLIEQATKKIQKTPAVTHYTLQAPVKHVYRS